MFKRLFHIKNHQGVMGLNKRNLTLIYPNNSREDYHLADDKVKSKELLHANNIACAETYAIITHTGMIKTKWQQCKCYKALAIKPANGSGGGGIKILKKDKNGFWKSGGKIISESQIYQHITSIVSGMFSMSSTDSCLIEECIIPHPFFAEIYDEGVPDFRIITLKGIPLIGMLRMPTSKSDGKANLHQKGVGIGVNMEEGTLALVYDGKQYLDHHPDNPLNVVGKKIPYWKEMLQLAIDTAKIFPLDYMGIDIVLDAHKGPQIMEVNVRPGLGIQLVNQCGMEKIVRQHYPAYFETIKNTITF
jgi:alpha-L-glutamate ligase-like protein